MMRSKLLSRATALLLLTALLCVCVNISLNQPIEVIAENTDSRPFDATSFFAAHRLSQVLTEAYNDSQTLLLCSSERRALTGRRTASQALLSEEQDLRLNNLSYPTTRQVVHMASSGDRRLSLLALSLGGNSPPVYHA